MRSYSLALVSMFVLAACGDDGGTSPADGPSQQDSAASSVAEVDCASVTPDATVVVSSATGTAAYDPMTTNISVNGVVKFTMPGSHSAVSGSPPGTADGKFRVNFNETKCLRFTEAGTYPFWCDPHHFMGSIVVQ